MDTYLVEYLRSGNVWVLVGAGPSIEIGYPSWPQLADATIELLREETASQDLGPVVSALGRAEFPEVFELAARIVGIDRLLSHLNHLMVPKAPSRIYKYLADWPVSVYLTTNYDDEIQGHLAALGEAYNTYGNSQDHFAFLGPSLKGAIIKLHGDLRSRTGLVLTSSQYADIDHAPEWEYWRTKLTSVFQSCPVIVVGHSLTDPNIRHVLEAAKQGAGVHQPVCWLAPDVTFEQSKELLEKYRIRVVPYDNREGTHVNLLRLVENVGQFVFPRTAVRIKADLARALQSPLGPNAAAPGFFVFTKLLPREDFEQKRVEVVCAAVQAVIPQLKSMSHFTLEDALRLAGWPPGSALSSDFADSIAKRATSQGLLSGIDGGFAIGPSAEARALEMKALFDHVKARFIKSLALRVRRNYSAIGASLAESIATEIESSLVSFFREAGLSLATTLLSASGRPLHTPIPQSIMKFISAASAKFDDLLTRQAYYTTSVDIFSQPEEADREYLGRVSQGFFAFHALGLFGQAATERIQRARDTVWIVDSSAQIPAIALAAPTSLLFRGTFLRLTQMGIRLFTTEKLFDETYEHYWFANRVIQENGPQSPMVLAAAQGQPPYRKGNQLLEGFVRWRAAGNQADWDLFLYQATGVTHPDKKQLREAITELGIEVIDFDTWPGYRPEDILLAAEYTHSIVDAWEEKLQTRQIEDPDLLSDFHDKAGPEAEAFIIVLKERDGTYHAISEPLTGSPSWFVSQTSMLNLLYEGPRITWQPEAFLRFAATLAPPIEDSAATTAFDILLVALAETGVVMLDQPTLLASFGGIIDQATLDMNALAGEYDDVLMAKYT